jgi:DNA-binding transcriptional MerR regulator
MPSNVDMKLISQHPMMGGCCESIPKARQVNIRSDKRLEHAIVVRDQRIMRREHKISLRDKTFKTSSEYLLVKEFSKLCAIAVKKTLFFEEIGVLKPARINPDSQYREYTFDQVATVKEILALRAGGLPYPVMKLRTSNPESYRILLRNHRDQLILEIKERSLQVEVLDNALAK